MSSSSQVVPNTLTYWFAMRAQFSSSALSLPEANSGSRSTSSRTLCGLGAPWSSSTVSLGVSPKP